MSRWPCVLGQSVQPKLDEFPRNFAVAERLLEAVVDPSNGLVVRAEALWNFWRLVNGQLAIHFAEAVRCRRGRQGRRSRSKFQLFRRRMLLMVGGAFWRNGYCLSRRRLELGFWYRGHRFNARLSLYISVHFCKRKSPSHRELIKQIFVPIHEFLPFKIWKRRLGLITQLLWIRKLLI